MTETRKFLVGNRKMVYEVQDEEKKCLFLLLGIKNLRETNKVPTTAFFCCQVDALSGRVFFFFLIVLTCIRNSAQNIAHI